MKPKTTIQRLKFIIMVLLVGFITLPALQAQTRSYNRVREAFGIDGDLWNDTIFQLGVYENRKKSGVPDWFRKPSKYKNNADFGNNVIDISGAAKLFSIDSQRFYVLNQKNNVFNKKMSRPDNDTVNGRRWIKAAYLRDGVDADDLTTYRLKNLSEESPLTWKGHMSKASPKKNDIIEAAVMMLRDSVKAGIDRSHIMFYGMTTVLGVSGSANLDYELYRSEDFTYRINTPVTADSQGTFINSGLNDGHTAWRFDRNTGDLLKYGDLEINVIGSGGGKVDLVGLYIWMQKSTWDSMTASPTPLLPRAGNISFDSTASDKFLIAAGNTHGYAKVRQKASADTIFYGQVTVNPSPAPPWGGFIDGPTLLDSSQLQKATQLLEFGLDFTLMGIDPFDFKTDTTNDWCAASFGSVMIKTRTSGASTSANLSDFVGPVSFKLTTIPKPVVSLTGGINCLTSNACLTVTNTGDSTANAYYQWYNINKLHYDSSIGAGLSYCTQTPGTYRVYPTWGEGCKRSDSFVDITIISDSLAPIATVVPLKDSVWAPNRLYRGYAGGDSLLTIAQPGYGTSQGFTWHWDGPIDYPTYSANTQNIILGVNDSPGIYTLTMTEKRNGCKSTALAELVVLGVNLGYFSCLPPGSGATLAWMTVSETDVARFEIERYSPNGFITVGSILPKGSPNTSASYQWTDPNRELTNGIYRLRIVDLYNNYVYSSACNSNAIFSNKPEDFKVYPNPATKVVGVSYNAVYNGNITLYIRDNTGRTLLSSNVKAQEGSNFWSMGIDNLPNGVYYLTLENGSELKTQSFIK